MKARGTHSYHCAINGYSETEEKQDVKVWSGLNGV